jgi:uncharacterized protein YdeI (YjbR/CyaY-like superfamily)
MGSSSDAKDRDGLEGPPMELKLVRFANAGAFETWLRRHHADTPDGLWLELSKKGSPFTTVTYAEALDVALCFGWIDGQKGSVGAASWKQRFTPRRPRSLWSRVNCAKAEALISEGRMQPSGLAEVERAKNDGRWAVAYDSPKNATVPDDLAQALARTPKARTLFEALDATNRYAILHRIATARKAETRSRRIQTFVADLSVGKVPWPDRLPKALRSGSRTKPRLRKAAPRSRR